MASRIMISPVVQTTVGDTVLLKSKAESYCDLGFVNFFPSGEDGMNASSWVITLGRASSWTAANADPQIEFLFPVPGTVDTPAELRQFLRSNTIGNLTTAQRNNMQAVFDNHGIPRSDFTLATTGAQVLKRAIGWLMQTDHNYGMSFEF